MKITQIKTTPLWFEVEVDYSSEINLKDCKCSYGFPVSCYVDLSNKARHTVRPNKKRKIELFNYLQEDHKEKIEKLHSAISEYLLNN